MRRLPSLNALKAFEACARRCSFTLASEELLVTQSAVSRQVKALEEYLGVRLIIRQTRKLELTQHGQELLAVLTEVFDHVATIVSGIQHRGSDLRIRVPPTLAIRWLISRLPGFREKNPSLEVLLSTGWNPVNFAKEDFDAGIICSANLNDYDDSVEMILVAEEKLTPVCSPNLIRDDAPLNEPQDIQRYTLVHGSEEHDFWRDWFEVTGTDIDPNCKSQTFDLMDTSLHAVVRGIGIALAPRQYVIDDLALGRLIMPFPNIAPPISAYYFVRPKSAASQHTEKFLQWLLETVRVEWADEPLSEAMDEEYFTTGPVGRLRGRSIRTDTAQDAYMTCKLIKVTSVQNRPMSSFSRGGHNER